MNNIINCELCGEDAMVVSVTQEEVFVRVRRTSKCIYYKRAGVCKTDVVQNSDAAIKLWNHKQLERREAK